MMPTWLNATKATNSNEIIRMVRIPPPRAPASGLARSAPRGAAVRSAASPHGADGRSLGAAEKRRIEGGEAQEGRRPGDGREMQQHVVPFRVQGCRDAHHSGDYHGRIDRLQDG